MKNQELDSHHIKLLNCLTYDFLFFPPDLISTMKKLNNSNNAISENKITIFILQNDSLLMKTKLV